ncbi:TetR/AcrR family transcriptional regulator [Fuscovulum ytuae]|uniref:TetR/AcrR family transcriptional regulator n=1 Tax=Fuscovulum ytuae TaxID=3042299 RepID=A0ABY8Q2D5_9RHOB|nr:TetR/AcrR family transcriptional regulator [Fuscovulum sp. YMD61]WGV14956.1 TetR/AcrR family transcriptional regulator [Fuscovulum sp. YMD61]
MTRGRPANPRLSRDAILTEALSLIRDPVQPFTIRTLAKRMSVTPMAILHHFGSHDSLIHAMADAILAEIPGASPKTLLAAYAKAAHRHPALILALFRIPGPLPLQARLLTERLEIMLENEGRSPDEARLHRDILIDWVHGMALAQAPDDPAPALNALLDALTPGCNAPR